MILHGATLQAGVATTLNNPTFNVTANSSITGSNNINIENTSGGTFTAATTLTDNNTAVLTLNGTMTGTGSISVGNNATLTAAANNALGTGTTTIASSGIVNVDGSGTPLTLANSFNIGGTLNSNGAVTNNLTGTNMTISGSSAVINAASGNTLNISAPINDAVLGADNLNLDGPSGTISITSVGATTPLASLNITTPNGVGTLDLNGNVTTTGTQSYLTTVLLINSVLTGAGISLNGCVTGNNNNLTLADSSTSTLAGAITGLNSITTNAVNINDGSITTTNGQTYNGAASLGQNTTLTGTGIDFASSITGNSNSLTLADNSTSILGGAVTGLSALTTNAVDVETNAITTTNAQTYNGAVDLFSPTTLSASNMLFNGTLNGDASLVTPANLTLNVQLTGSNTTKINSAIGSQIGSLTLNSTPGYTGTLELTAANAYQ